MGGGGTAEQRPKLAAEVEPVLVPTVEIFGVDDEDDEEEEGELELGISISIQMDWRTHF